MGGKCGLNYLPIVPKASIYVPKVMHKPVMIGDTIMSETFTHISSEVCEVLKSGLDSQFSNVMAEHGREGCVELSSHCAQSLHIYYKGNAKTSSGC